MKSDIVYLTGAPGSGKTTLAIKLTERMYSYTYIDPDDILQSFWETNTDPTYDREKIGVPKMKNILTYLLYYNVRILFSTQADKDLLTELNSKFSLVNIHCVSKDSAKRFYDRETAEDGSKPDWLDPHMPEVYRLEKEARDPIDIGQKIITVDCTKDYSPTIEELIRILVD
jgi:GTPase SAR1 family protein